MYKIKDRIALGAVSGVIAGVPDTLKNALEYRAGLTDLTYGQMGANLFLPKKKARTGKAQPIGYLANLVLTGLSGVFFTYLLTLTGRDHAPAKGIGLGLASWLTVYGLGTRVGLGVGTKKPLAPLLSFTDHLIFGCMLGLITPALGDDSLFPDGRPAAGDKKLPLVQAGT